MEVIEFKFRPIRKLCKCFMCRRQFDPDTKMYYFTCVDYGQFTHGRTCETCEKIQSLLSQLYGENEFEEGYTRECLDKGQTPEEFLQTLIDKKSTKK